MSENANEYKGSTVDEAVEIGLKELNLKESDVEIEVLSHGGLFKKAKVLIKTKEVKAEESTTEEVVNVEKTVKIEKVERVTVPATLEELKEAAAKAEAYAKNIINLMNIECDIAVSYKTEGIDIAITGQDANKIIGYRGETIDAIQYLILVYINKEKRENEFIRVSIDSDDYRVKREQVLTSLAHKLAKKVVDYKKPAKLEPMNPFERRIIHSALQDNELVKTESFGDGKDRYVVILLKDATYRPSNFNRERDNRGGNFNRDRKFDNNRGDRPRRNYDNSERPRSNYDSNSSERPRRNYDNSERPKSNYDNNGERPRSNYGSNSSERPRRNYDNSERPKSNYDNNRTDRPRRDFDNRGNNGYQKKYDRPDTKVENKETTESTEDNNFSAGFKKTGPSKLKSFGYNKKRF